MERSPSEPVCAGRLKNKISKICSGPKVLDAPNGYPIFYTNDYGWIGVSTDGEKMWVRTER
jgi:hypothetical protein